MPTLVHMTTYRDVLRHKEMPAVLSAQAVSLTGTVAAQVALSVLIYRRTSSPLLSSLTLACAFVPQAFSAIVLSGLVDRIPARRLLVGIDLLSAVLVGFMTIPGTPTAVLLLLAAATGVVTPLFSGARAATLADLLSGEVWVRARSMLRVLSQSSLLLGFAVGGLALAAVGPRPLLVVDALSFVASALVLRFGTSERPARASGSRRPSLVGLSYVLRTPRLRTLLLMMWIPGAAMCSVDALATPYATPSSIGIGLMLAAAAAGSIASEVLGRHVGRAVLPVALLTPVGLLLLGFHPPVWLAIPVVALAMQGGAIGQYLDGELLAALPDEIRGQLLALQQGLFMGIQGAAIALAGALAEIWAPQYVLAGAGALGLVAVVILLPRVLGREPAAANAPAASSRRVS